MKQFFHLRDVVEVEVLQEIQDKYAEATGLAAVIVDDQGKPVTNYSKFSPFCQLVRRSAKGRERCQQSDAHAGREAVRQNKPYIHRCHTGLVDLAAPIVVNGQYLGSLLAGQVLLVDEELASLEWLIEPGIKWWQESEMSAAYRDIPVVSKAKVEAAAQLMYVVANYIVEKGVTSIVQQQLAEKNIRIMEEVRARAELEKALKETELKALQSQINPHFLFNTLNTISRLALLEGADKTQEVVFALSELIRYSLRRIDGVVSLREELNHIEQYLLIQEVRFGDRINKQIAAEEQIMEIKIPLLTLQPLVENAIVHGLEPQEEGGTVWVEGKKNGGKVVITVSDDGQGMTPQQVEEILKLDAPKSGRGHTTGIGIVNVHKRLQHFYGKDYNFNIHSKPGQGTRIEISLPYYF